MQRTFKGESVWLLGEDEEAAAALQSAVKKSLLTSREEEVLALMVRRYTNEEVSGELYISLQTTKNHVSSILRKLDKKSRRDLFH